MLAVRPGLDAAAMQVDQPVGDGEPDPEAPVSVRALHERCEEPLRDFRRQPGPRVAHAELALVAATEKTDGDRAARGCELERVPDQVRR